MKRLYLFRHAKSSWDQEWLDDFERPLNRRGKRDAPMMGGLLASHGVCPSLIISSPAARAASTARIVAEALDYPLEDVRYTEGLYDAGVAEILAIIRSLDEECPSAMLFGHNPGLTAAANLLTGEDVANVPTAGVVAMKIAGRPWSAVQADSAELLFFEYPRKHRSNAGTGR